MTMSFHRIAPALLALAGAQLLALPAAAAGTARRLQPPPVEQVSVRYMKDGLLTCRPATREEAVRLWGGSSAVGLHVISPLRPLAARAAGLTITLRGTEQLEANPQAKAAFLKAADIWMSKLHTPVTIVIDVDFGTKNFGTDFGPGVLGSTRSQLLGDDAAYPEVTADLAEHRTATPPFPATQLPTDVGATTAVVAPSAIFRVLGEIDPVADPEGEQASFGKPPAIGFNSEIRYAWDFNPEDGIPSDGMDFVATAVHEIGHVLGFNSMNGYKEDNPSGTNYAAVWDFFRFRPGVTTQTFTTENRILSTGGMQVFFCGTASLELSTGGTQGKAGDGQQSSHWKADEQSGVYVGIMDPTLAPGDREEITDNDLLALDAMGWHLGAAPVPTTSWILPSSAKAPGMGGAYYSTALSIGNRGNAEARYRIQFLGHDADGTTGPQSAEFVLGPNQSVTYEDVLGSVFSLPAPAYGAIRVTADTANLSVAGQTSTPDPSKPGGTFGQSVPAFGPSDLIGSGAIRSIVGVRHDTSFRTNLVLANGGTAAVTIAGTLLSTSGAVLGTGSWTLPPLGMTQVTGVVPAVGATGAVRDAQLLLTTTSGSFAAYAAIIDNVTNDPRTLLPK